MLGQCQGKIKVGSGMLESGTKNGLAVECKYGGVNNWLIVPLKKFFPVYMHALVGKII